MRLQKIAAIALLAALVIWTESTAADIKTTDAEGWHTWRVDETGPVDKMCCFTRQRGSPSQMGCNLDGGRVSYGNDGDCAVEAGSVQVYALMKNSRPMKIRVLSSNCPVSTETGLIEHGIVSSEDNIEWFRAVIEDRQLSQDIREEALFALVQSESDAAFEYLERLLTRR